jgi:hypothetical protein
MEESCQFRAPAALAWVKSPPYPLDMRLSGPQSLSERSDEEKKIPSLILSRIEPRSSNPYPSIYTDVSDWTNGVWFPTGEVKGREYISSLPCPDQLWCPPSLLSSAQQSFFTHKWSGRGVKLTTHLHLETRL